MKAKRTSLNDIAKALNVSKATVSFVLNDKGDQFNISKEKQRLIKAKAKELSYVPNFFAKSLRQGSTNTIGLVLPDISNAFYAELCKTIQERLYDQGYNTFIVNTNDDAETEKSLMSELIQRSIDGMIIAPSNDIKELIPILRSTHIPVVFTDRPGDDETDFVGINNEEEAGKLIEEFTVKPKKILALAPHFSSVTTIQDRISGIKKACDIADIEFDVVSLEKDQGNVNEVIEKELNNGADTFIALNNQSTMPVIAALNKWGVSIPEHVRFIAFDDNASFAYMNPPISAVRLPITEIGDNTVARMYERLKETKEYGKHIILPCEFIKRGTH
ncbi:MAG: LacI family transcriptional regulator [Crocinitomicaceae bacterium]|nr:LacI family transcriptional regulator [Crocinitomicaceae bacterium]